MLCSQKQFGNCINIEGRLVTITLKCLQYQIIQRMVILLKLLNRHASTNIFQQDKRDHITLFDWPLQLYTCTISYKPCFLCECFIMGKYNLLNISIFCGFLPLVQHIKFIIFLSETKESSGSCQRDGTKTNGNESVPVCQRPSSSLSLHSISSESALERNN